MGKAQAKYIDYELHTLGWRAFQDLCVVIMRDIWGNTVQSFCDTHDGGRDGAFYGSWKHGDDLLQGQFCVQCKFSSDANKSLKPSDLKDEIEKAERLAQKGLAKIYVLFTNNKLTGKTEETVKAAFESIDGIEKCLVFGKDRIALEIQGSPRLRVLVPRVYGLGDLSQILEERACQQAQEILSSLGDDLNKFVRTSAFHQSANALIEHGFVLLLGEPACGKSTIAAALAVGAIDEWECSTIKITTPDEFISHWNPNDPKRFYWVDDAFGATQMDYSLTLAWNRVFPQINAAIRQGAKILFTSRDYIYRSARQYLKETALPVVKSSQVVINIQDITAHEKEQILYNHIKLGTQKTEFKKLLKPYLQSASENQYFTPESARRLGNPIFTKSLYISEAGISDFLERPMDFLLEIITNLDNESFSALSLIFMNQGVLSSPINCSPSEEEAISMTGGTLSGIRSSLNAMDNSLVVKLRENNQYVWRYKHPTIRDAFSAYTSQDIELISIYLMGAEINTVIREVSCGVEGIEGVKILVPNHSYATLINRLNEINQAKWDEKASLIRFLSKRCDKNFLQEYIKTKPNFYRSLKIVASFFLGSDIELILRLKSLGLLSEKDREEYVTQITKNATSEHDPQFLEEEIRRFLSPDEFNTLRDKVRQEVIFEIESIIDRERDYYEPENGSPREHFENIESAIRAYKSEYTDDDSLTFLEEAEVMIEQVIDELHQEYGYFEEPADTSYSSRHQSYADTALAGRSIFDDVDL